MKTGKVFVYQYNNAEEIIIKDVYKCIYCTFSKSVKVYQLTDGCKSETVLTGGLIKSISAEGVHIQVKGD